MQDTTNGNGIGMDMATRERIAALLQSGKMEDMLEASRLMEGLKAALANHDKAEFEKGTNRMKDAATVFLAEAAAAFPTGIRTVYLRVNGKQGRNGESYRLSFITGAGKRFQNYDAEKGADANE